MIKPNFRHTINGKKLAIGIAQDYKTGEILMAAHIWAAMSRQGFHNRPVKTHAAVP